MEPPNPASIDMRHTKLKASEAALIAGELVKPTWASRNEGIHERVSFEDTLWGFEMAGGAYYKTPLRIAYVKPESRAEHACIRMGDMVLRINGKDTANMTLQEAHQLVVDAGLNLKIVVTSPDDKENAHYDYEDPIIEEPVLTPEQLKALELERVRRALERASRCRDLPWPWVRRKWVIYRESNCFMVPSKYEDKHRDKFPKMESQRIDYFYPVEKNKTKEGNTKADNKVSNGLKNDGLLEEDEKYEEVEEEIEEDEEIGTENDINDEALKDNLNETLEDENIENDDNSIDKSVNSNLEENSSIKLDSDAKVLDENNTEELQRKDSNQSASSYELDSNNNHVAKHKDEINEESPHNDSTDDKIIDEIAENSNGQENMTKSDDDIIDSVLNDNLGSDLQNER